MSSPFTPYYRGGAGPPLVLLHGFADTWRMWDLVLPQLEARHDVLALTLPGHAGGPPLGADASTAGIVDAIERMLDDAGVRSAHIAGNSLGGYLALQLATRGRARSVVAFAPAGGWAAEDESYRDVLALQARMHADLRAAAPHAVAQVASDEGRRRATRLVTVNYEHIPPELIADMLLGVASCRAAPDLIADALDDGFDLDAERIACPVRIVWGTDDRLLPWPSAAMRYRSDWLPHADWVMLDGVGHCPPLDVPLVAAQLILGFTA